ncbi:MAG: hypothetical protein U9Q97_04230, partial [Acidobacteriota bacterium]|nr:hypothetical protein [Acidobacteriota bacterium]
MKLLSRTEEILLVAVWWLTNNAYGGDHKRRNILAARIKLQSQALSYSSKILRIFFLLLPRGINIKKAIFRFYSLNRLSSFLITLIFSVLKNKRGVRAEFHF